MDKLIFCFGRRPELTVEQFQAHYLRQHAPLAMRLTRGVHRYVVHLRDVGPVDSMLVGNPPPFAFDAVTMLWVDSAADFFDPSKAFDRPEDLDTVMADQDSFIGEWHGWLVSERVVADDGSYARTGRVDGATYLSAMVRADGITREQMDAHWRDRHAPLAQAHHVGMTRYVHNTVQRALTPDAPDVDGFVEMHFPTVEDFRDRYFAGPDSIPVIMEDAARFIAPSTTGEVFGAHVQRWT